MGVDVHPKTGRRMRLCGDMAPNRLADEKHSLGKCTHEMAYINLKSHLDNLDNISVGRFKGGQFDDSSIYSSSAITEYSGSGVKTYPDMQKDKYLAIQFTIDSTNICRKTFYFKTSNLKNIKFKDEKGRDLEVFHYL